MRQARRLGSNAQAVVTLQRKGDVLPVPKRASQSADPRRQVEVVEGTSRRNVDVQVGIVRGGEAEVLSRLSLRQFVMVEP
jgi:membrane fusion protein, macrolide-specific efflux system